MEIFNTLGTIVTFIALFITICQMKRTKGKVEAVNEAVTKTREEVKARMDTLINLEEVAKFIQLTHNISNDIRGEHWERALYQIQSLHEFLISFKEQEKLMEYVSPNFCKTIAALTTDKGKIKDMIYDKNDSVDTRSIDKNLDIIMENLIRVKYKLKQ